MHAAPVGYDDDQVAVALVPADRFKNLAVFGKPGVGRYSVN